MKKSFFFLVIFFVIIANSYASNCLIQDIYGNCTQRQEVPISQTGQQSVQTVPSNQPEPQETTLQYQLRKVEQEERQNPEEQKAARKQGKALILLFFTFIYFVVTAIVGMRKCLRKEIMIFDTKIDLAISPICFYGGFLTVFVFGSLGIYFFWSGVLIYNIVQSIRLGKTPWGMLCTFSARTVLNLLSLIIIVGLLSPTRSNYNTSGGTYHQDGAGEQLVNMAFWVSIAACFYSWVMKFIRDEQECDLQVGTSIEH